MYVNTAILEQSPPPSRTVHDPTWDEVQQMIELMDGRECTSLILEHTEEDYLTIGGGGAQYICEIYKQTAPSDFHFWNLVDPNPRVTEPVRMMVGVEIYVEPQNCVDRSAVIRAAKTYCESGAVDATLPWERE